MATQGNQARQFREQLQRSLAVIGSSRLNLVRSIYDSEYAAAYKSLYIDQWTEKHAVNFFLVQRLLPAPSERFARWLDVGCGPAWHFSKVRAPGVAKIGLDISLAQLSVARAANPDASFVCADMTTSAFGDCHFGLVTSFWSPYSYLESVSQVEVFVRQLASWAAPDGSVYLDLIVPQTVASFSRSEFSRETGFSIEQLAEDGTRWIYKDTGGDHEIVTPGITTFQDCLTPYFADIVVKYDRHGFAHLVAIGQRE